MRARMTLGFATVIGLLMLLVCVGVASYLHYFHRRAVDELLDISVREIGIELRGSLKNTTDPVHFMKEGGEEMRDRDLALFVVDRSGRVLAQSQKHIPSGPDTGTIGWCGQFPSERRAHKSSWQLPGERPKIASANQLSFSAPLPSS
jgi:hypothetical protein